MYYIFTQDEHGRLGYSRKEYYSKVAADSAADDIPGITHVIEANSLDEAKQILRGKLVEKGDTEALYKNVRSA